MYSSAKLYKSSIIIICVIIILGLSHTTFAQFPDFEISVNDSVTGITCGGQQNVEISINLKNFADTVAGFTLWLHLNRPDVMEFQTNFETVEYNIYYIYTEWDSSVPPIPTDSVIASTYWVCHEWNGDECISSKFELGYYKCTEWFGLGSCIDSVFIPWQEGVDPVYTESYEAQVGSFDTVGTLIQGWEMVETSSLYGNGQEILITAVANQVIGSSDDYTQGIGFPQIGDVPLIKIIADYYPMDETMDDRTAEIMIEYNFIDNFSLLNENGQSLGVINESVERLKYYLCEQWLVPDEICMYWNRVLEYECPPAGCDSIGVDTVVHQYVDVDRCCDPSDWVCNEIINEFDCAHEFGGTGVWHDGSVLITNGSFEATYCPCGDFDNDGNSNILDVVFLINQIYKGGPAPHPALLADTNNDGKVDILDIVCLLNTIYKEINCCGNGSL